MVRSINDSRDRKLKIQCNCGNWVETDTEVSRVDCECGNIFAVTITDMGKKSPDKILNLIALLAGCLEQFLFVVFSRDQMKWPSERL